MAKTKKAVTAVAAPQGAKIIQPGANPHTWLALNPLPGHVPQRFLFGVLMRDYHGRANAAAEFIGCKLQPVPPAPGLPTGAITAARAEVVLPADADDRFADPAVLAREVDVEAANTGKPALLAYITLYYPDATRLHHVWEDGRALARRLADERKLASVVVLHAPGKAASKNPVHVHLAVVPRLLDGLGLGAYDSALCFERGQKLLYEMWLEQRREAVR